MAVLSSRKLPAFSEPVVTLPSLAPDDQHRRFIREGLVEIPPVWNEPPEATALRVHAALDAQRAPDPSVILGEGYGEPLHWDHKDDMFVDFQVYRGLVVGDPDFFMRYMKSELTEEEKQEFSYIFHPCFAEMTELVNSYMFIPLQELNEDQRCAIVVFQNVLGILLVTEDDAVDVIRRSIGLEDETKKTHYQLQFMRFDETVIKRLDLAGDVIEQYHAHKAFRPALRVNFAQYNETAIENE